MTNDKESTNDAEKPRKKGLSLQTFASLSNHNVRFLFFGTLFTSAGNWIQVITLGILAWELTENPVVVATVLGSRSVPWLVFGPFAGVMIDRMDRRKVLLTSQVLRICLALVLGTVLILDLLQVWMLYLYIILNGVGWVLDNPSRQVVIANSVPKESLQNALSLVQLSFGFNRILFPVIGGIIIDLAGGAIDGGASINILIQAACYMMVFIMFSQIRVERKESVSKARKSVFHDFAEGVRYVSKERTVLGLIIMGLVPSFFLRPFADNMLVVFAEEVLMLNAARLGILMAIANIGIFLGTFLMATFSNVRQKGMLLITTAVVSGLCLLALSQTNEMVLASLFLLLMGISSAMYHILNATIIMTVTPDEYRGRVTTLFMLDQSGAPLGGLLAGSLAALLAVKWSMLAGGILTSSLVAVIGISFKSIRTSTTEVPVATSAQETIKST